MTPQQGFNVAKPNFQFTFEPGFVDGCNLISPCQLLKLLDQVLLPGFFCPEFSEEGVHRLTFGDRVDEVLLVGFD